MDDQPRIVINRPTSRRVGRTKRILLALVIAVIGATSWNTASAAESHAAQPIECMALPTFVGNAPTASMHQMIFAIGQDAGKQLGGVEWAAEHAYPKDGTVFEAVSMAGTTWTFSKVGKQKGKVVGFLFGTEEGEAFARKNDTIPEGQEFYCSYGDAILTQLANTVFDLAKFLTTAALAFRILATNPEPILSLLDGAIAPVTEYGDLLFFGGVVLGLMLHGLWLALSGAFRGNYRAILGSVAIALVSIFIGAALLTHTTQGPDLDSYPKGPDGKPIGPDGQPVTKQSKPNYYWMTTSAMGVIDDLNAGTADILLPTGAESTVCKLDDGQKNRALRMFNCRIYETVIFNTWSQGQYGHTDKRAYNAENMHRFKKDAETWGQDDGMKEADLRVLQVRAQALSISEGALSGSSTDDGEISNPKVKQGQWNIIREMVYTEYAADFEVWRGGNASERLSLAVMSVVMSALVGAFVVLTSALVLIWNMTLVVLFYFLPVVAFLGTIPLTQKFLLHWLTTWVKAFVMLGICGLAQMLGLMMTSSTMSLPNTGLGMKAILMLVMILGLWKIIQFARNDGLSPNFAGGQPSMFDGEQAAQSVKEGTQKATGMASKAVAFGAGAVTARKLGGRGKGVDGKPKLSPKARAKVAKQEQEKADSNWVDGQLNQRKEEYSALHGGRDMPHEKVEQLRTELHKKREESRLRPQQQKPVAKPTTPSAAQLRDTTTTMDTEFRDMIEKRNKGAARGDRLNVNDTELRSQFYDKSADEAEKTAKSRAAAAEAADADKRRLAKRVVEGGDKSITREQLLKAKEASEKARAALNEATREAAARRKIAEDARRAMEREQSTRQRLLDEKAETEAAAARTERQAATEGEEALARIQREDRWAAHDKRHR